MRNMSNIINWIDAEAKKPELFTDVLVYAFNDYMIAHLDEDNMWCSSCGVGYEIDWNIKYWMPLPKPPK